MTNVTIGPEGITGDVKRKRLPLIFLIDNSGSMAGAKIQQLNKAMRDLIHLGANLERELRIEMFVRCIIFGGIAKWHIGPQAIPIASFIWKDLFGDGGSTPMASAIELLNDVLADKDGMGFGNVPPLCVLISDGCCTEPHEKFNKAIDRLNNLAWGKKAIRLSIGVGADTDHYCPDFLRAFASPNLDILPVNKPEDIAHWIRKAVVTHSRSASIPRSRAVTFQGSSLPHVDLTSEDLLAPDPLEEIQDADEVF